MATTCHAGPQRPAGRRTPIAASGTKTPSRTMSCEPVPRMPSVCQVSLISRPRGVEGDREVQHRRAALGIVEDRHRHEQVSGRRAAREDLSTGYPVAARPPSRRARTRPASRSRRWSRGSPPRPRRGAGAAPPGRPRGASARPRSRPGGCASPAPARSSRSAARARAPARRARRARRHRRRARRARRPRTPGARGGRGSCRRRRSPSRRGRALAPRSAAPALARARPNRSSTRSLVGTACDAHRPPPSIGRTRSSDAPHDGRPPRRRQDQKMDLPGRRAGA